MPELPEVESLKLSLKPFVIGQKILEVQVTMPKLVSAKGTTRKSDPKKVDEFIKGLTGKKIINIQRRAKNLIFELENNSLLLVHLKMTGQLAFKDDQRMISGGHPIQESETILPNKHTYVSFKLEHGSLYYNDVRQFGYLLFFPSKQAFLAENHFDGLGLEPLEESFTEGYFKKNIKKTGNIKKLLLDQKVVVGLGNIYADEVLFRSKILPSRDAKSLTATEIQNLYTSIKEIIPKAIKMGGSSVANYIMADGSRGTYAREHKVYKRAGKNCYICGNILQKTTIGGRTTVFCTTCQK